MSSSSSATPTVLGSVTLTKNIKTSAFYFVFAIVFGIVNWALNGNPILRTISDTWTIPPASYYSRLLVGVGCVTFQVANLAIYRCNQDIGPRASASWVNKLCLVLSCVAIFALSWVGAICDSTKETCRGNDDIHLTFAFTFFIFYNAYMAILTIRAHHQHADRPRLRGLVWATLMLSLLSKVRSFSAHGGFSPSYNESWVGATGGDELVALIEWIDVLLIVIWTVAYVSLRAPDFQVSKVRFPSGRGVMPRLAPLGGSKSLLILNHISGFTLSVVANLLIFLLLVVTFVVQIFVTKSVPVPNVFGGNGTWPSMSELWVSVPGNWLSRWTLVFVSVLLAAYNNLFAYTLDKMPRVLKCLVVFFGLIASSSLGVAGAVDVYEDADLHKAILSCMFFSFNFVALVVSAMQIFVHKERRLIFAGIALAIMGTFFRVFIHVGGSDDDSAASVSTMATTTSSVATTDDYDAQEVAVESMSNLLQWLNATMLLVFISFYTQVKTADFEKLCFAISFVSNQRAPRRFDDVTLKVPTTVQYAVTIPSTTGKGDECNETDDSSVVTAELVKSATVV